MKKMKYLLFGLAITLTFSTIATYASTVVSDTLTYLGVTLPAFNGTKALEERDKINPNKGQKYHNGGNVNSCTGNENAVKVKIVYVGEPKGDIIVKKLGYNETGEWDDKAVKIAHKYHPIVSNNTLSPCTSSHTSIWYHY